MLASGMNPQRVVQMERMHFHLEEYLLHNSSKPAHMDDPDPRFALDASALDAHTGSL